MAWIKGKKNQKKVNDGQRILEGYQPSYGPNKPIAPVGGSGVSNLKPIKPVAKEGAILNEGLFDKWILKKSESQKEKSIFPMLIQYTDTKEYATCKQPSDINVGKRFKIIKMDFK
jgi:hypothetical protein